jgi:hypothetical protein
MIISKIIKTILLTFFILVLSFIAFFFVTIFFPENVKEALEIFENIIY